MKTAIQPEPPVSAPSEVAPEETVMEPAAKSRSIVFSAGSAAVVTATCAALLRLFLLVRTPFDGLYGQDAYFYLQATRTLAGIWSTPQTLWSWLTSAGTPPVSVWPLGYHIQMALASLVVGQGPLSGQSISLLAGIATPAFTSLLFVALARPGVGRIVPAPRGLWFGAVLSGLVVAFSALAFRSSVVVMADMAGIMWATLGSLLAVHYARQAPRRTSLGLLAGLCIGIASITRYVYPLLVLPLLWFLLEADSGASASLSRRERVVRFLKLCMPVFAPVIVLVGLQLLHNAIHPTPGLPSPVISNWSPANAFGTHFSSPDGQLSYHTPMLFFFLVRPFYAATMLGLPVGLLACLGGVALVLRRARFALPLTLGWWSIFGLFYSGNVYQADRFVLSYLPPLALCAGFGLLFLLSSARSLLGRVAMPSVLAGVVGLAGIAVLLVGAQRDYSNLVAGKNDYLQASACLSQAYRSSPGIPVLTFGLTFTAKEYSYTNPRDLYYETPQSVAGLLGGPNGTVRGFLALPLDGFEEQWGSTPVGQVYSYLKSHYQWTRLPCDGTSFSLFSLR